MVLWILLFPPVNSGGLIEARDPTHGPRTTSPQFPPVNSGGLIEARCSEPSVVSRSRFRR